MENDKKKYYILFHKEKINEANYSKRSQRRKLIIWGYESSDFHLLPAKDSTKYSDSIVCFMIVYLLHCF